MRNGVQPRGGRDDDERGEGANEEPPNRIEVSLMREFVSQDRVHLVDWEVAEQRVGHDDPPRSAESHHRGIRSPRLRGRLQFEHTKHRHVGASGERHEAVPQALILEWAESEEERDEYDGREEPEDRRDRGAKDPSDEPPPRRRREEPKEHASDDDRRPEAEGQRLPEIFHPSHERLRREADRMLPPESADLTEGALRRGEGAEQHREERHDRSPSPPTEGQEEAPARRRPAPQDDPRDHTEARGGPRGCPRDRRQRPRCSWRPSAAGDEGGLRSAGEGS